MSRISVRKLAALTIPLVLIAASGCSADDATSAGSRPSTASSASVMPVTLAQAMALWEDQGLRSYSLNLVSACGERGGLGTYKVTVTPDKTTAEGETRWSFGTDVQTVPDLFAFIDDEACYTVKDFEPLGLTD